MSAGRSCLAVPCICQIVSASPCKHCFVAVTHIWSCNLARGPRAGMPRKQEGVAGSRCMSRPAIPPFPTGPPQSRDCLIAHGRPSRIVGVAGHGRVGGRACYTYPRNCFCSSAVARGRLLAEGWDERPEWDALICLASAGRNRCTCQRLVACYPTNESPQLLPLDMQASLMGTPSLTGRRLWPRPGSVDTARQAAAGGTLL